MTCICKKMKKVKVYCHLAKEERRLSSILYTDQSAGYKREVHTNLSLNEV